MTKWVVAKWKYYQLPWVASCTHIWTSPETACSCRMEFKTWEEAFDYAFEQASRG